MNPHEMTLEQLVEEREKLVYQVDEIKAGVDVFNEEILIRLNDQKIKGTVVGDKTVSKVIRFIFSKVPIEKAQEFGCIKPSIDTVALKKIYFKNPESFPEVEKREGIMIRTMTQKDE